MHGVQLCNINEITELQLSEIGIITHTQTHTHTFTDRMQYKETRCGPGLKSKRTRKILRL